MAHLLPDSEINLPLDPDMDIYIPPPKTHMNVGIDIETSSLKADFGIILCAVVKPVGKDATVFRLDSYTKRLPWDDSPLVKDLVEYLSECSNTFGWYSKPFDVPYVRTRKLKAGQTDLIAFRHADLIRTARAHFKFHNNRLETWINNLSKHRKTDIHPDHWLRAMFCYKPSMDKVVEHCLMDVYGMEDVFLGLSPYIQTWQQIVL
jgi:uncharacterized protein YprB with RNaseH-like and TPR domain